MNALLRFAGKPSLQKRMWTYIFALAFILAATTNHSFAGTTAPQGAGQYRVAYIENQGYYSRSYNAKEYLTQYFNVLSKYLKGSSTFLPIPLDTYTSPSMNFFNTANIMSLTAKSPERLFRLKFSKNPIASTKIFLTAHRGEKIYFNDIQAFNNKSVAVLTGNSQATSLLDDYLQKNNISMEYIVYNNYVEYLFSDADFMLVNSFYFPKGRQVAASLGSQDLYLATIPKYAHLLEDLDEAIEAAQKFDAKALHALHLAHINKTTQFVRHIYGEAEHQMLQKPRKIAEVAFASQHFPIQYVNAKGEPAGISIEILELFRKMHNNPTILVPRIPEQGQSATRFDMLFSIVGDTEQKKKYFYRSKAYANLPMYLFQRKNLSNDDIQSFGMLDYTEIDHAKIKMGFPHWQMHIFANFDELFSAYKAGQINAILLSSSEAEYAISKLGMLENELASTLFTLPLHFYLSKAYPEAALTVLNAFIDRLTPFAVQEAILKAENAIRPPGTVKDFIYEHKFTLTLLAALGFVIIFILFALKTRTEKRRLQKLLITDAITGLSTKKHLYACVHKVLAKAIPNEYALVTVDIDKFSLLRQVYGSEKADIVLCLLAKALKAKYSDPNNVECIARKSGDLFVILLKTVYFHKMNAELDECLYLLEEVKDLLQNNYALSISIGCYEIDDMTLPPETILDYSHAAMLKSKGVHGLSQTVFTESMKTEIQAQKRIIYRMEQALENKEFILRFQPKVDLQTSEIIGAEVLVRWYPPGEKPIYPDNFISVFENNAFIAKLDMYVFEHACKFIHTKRLISPIPPLAVNLSGISVLNRSTYSQMKDIMQRYQISAHEIEIEITESALVSESDDFCQAINTLRTLGFKLSIDDFGTGVSSLYRLNSLHVDTVKLDKAFLDEKLTQRKGIILVASIIAMLHRLNMQVVAEGVETEKHVKMLQKMRCDIAQGYYFYAPLTAEEFLSRVMNTDASTEDQYTEINNKNHIAQTFVTQ